MAPTQKFFRGLHSLGLFLFFLLSALLISGCLGYKLGPSNGYPAGARSIQVLPFQNQTVEPRLSAPVTAAVRKSLQQDGTYSLSTHAGEGDLLLQGTITQLERTPLSYNPNDTLRTLDANLTLYTHVTVTDRHSGKLLLDKTLLSRTTIRLDSDQTSTEQQAIPLLADELARRITSYVTDGDW